LITKQVKGYTMTAQQRSEGSVTMNLRTHDGSYELVGYHMSIEVAEQLFLELGRHIALAKGSL
jgi:hypothetical protein